MTADIRPGTVLAAAHRHYQSKHVPHITHDLYTVSRLTPTQAVAVGEAGEIRVRLNNLRVVGTAFARIAVATPEIRERNAAEKAELQRWNAACRLLADLVGKELHQLNLSTAQLEALAQAWQHVKAMS